MQDNTLTLLFRNKIEMKIKLMNAFFLCVCLFGVDSSRQKYCKSIPKYQSYLYILLHFIRYLLLLGDI